MTDVLLRLVLCLAALYVLIWFAGMWGDVMRWRHRRNLMREWRKRYER